MTVHHALVAAEVVEYTVHAIYVVAVAAAVFAALRLAGRVMSAPRCGRHSHWAQYGVTDVHRHAARPKPARPGNDVPPPPEHIDGPAVPGKGGAR